jgi:hypothetical protein
MPSYYANEAVFDLPARPFADKTIHALEPDFENATRRLGTPSPRISNS